MNPQTIGIYLDVRNLWHAARRQNEGARVNYNALLLEISELGRVVVKRAYLTTFDDKHQVNFIGYLKSLAIDVAVKKIKDGSVIRPSETKWGVEMAADITRDSESLDVIVLCTGNGAYVDLVTELRRAGKVVFVYGFATSTAINLTKAATAWRPIDTPDNKLLLLNKE